MKPETIIGIVICLLVVCCLFTHRRVIRALIKHEPMPNLIKRLLKDWFSAQCIIIRLYTLV